MRAYILIMQSYKDAYTNSATLAGLLLLGTLVKGLELDAEVL